jgi:hypothetical protein
VRQERDLIAPICAAFDSAHTLNEAVWARPGRVLATRPEALHAEEEFARANSAGTGDCRIPACVAPAKQRMAAAPFELPEKSSDTTTEDYGHRLATLPDLLEGQRRIAAAHALKQAARVETWTRSAAFAVTTEDLAKP